MSLNIARLIQRTAGSPVSRFSFSASRPATAFHITKLRVLTHAFRTASTRSSAAKKTTARKTAVKKKPVAKKTAAKKTAVKKTAAKSKTTKKAVAKRAKKPVKKAAKPIRKKKVVKKAKKVVKKPAPRKKRALTDEEKFVEKVKAAKRIALKPPPYPRASAYNMFCVDPVNRTDDTAGFRPITKEVAGSWATLSASEKAKYDALAKERNDKMAVEYNKFLKSHTVDEIRLANNARRWLKLKQIPRFNTTEIKDPRKPKAVGSAYAQYIRENYSNFQGANAVEKAKFAGKTWRTLSESDKKPYFDMFVAEKARMKSEHNLQPRI